MRKSIGFVFIGGLIAAPAPGAVPDVAWLEAARQDWNVPGVALAIARHGETPVLLSAGSCNLERGSPCTARSQFPMASVTKFFTGVLAASLVVEDVLPFRQPISHAWPELRLSDGRWTDLSLQDLLSQRSGLGSVDWPYFWDHELGRADYLARLAHVPMAAPVRASWSYANANFVLAGEYLERHTGRSWQALMRERVFQPLDLEDAGFVMPRDDTRGYRPAKDGFVAYERPMSAALEAAGGLVFSAFDLARVLQMILGEGQFEGRDVLPGAAIRMASRVHVPWGHDRRFFSGPGGYGLGIFSAHYRGERVIYHPGGAMGFSSYMALLPERGLAVAVLSNRIGSEFPQAVALDVLDLLMGTAQAPGARWIDTLEEQTSPPLPGDDPSAPPTRKLSSYAGRYAHPAWGELEIADDQGRLLLRLGPIERLLHHHRFDSFSMSTEPGYEIFRLRFEADFGGDIETLVMDDGVNQQPMRFGRLPRP